MKFALPIDRFFSIRFKIITFFYTAFILLFFLGLITLQATQNIFKNQYIKSFNSDTHNLLSLIEQPYSNSNFILMDKILLNFYAEHQPYAILLFDNNFELIKTIGEYSPSLKLDPQLVFRNTQYASKQLLANGLFAYYFPSIIKKSVNMSVVIFTLPDHIIKHTNDEFNRIKQAVTIVLITFFIAGNIIILLLNREIILPLKQLRTSFRELGEGNFHYRLDIIRRDEFGQVSMAYNSMIDELRRNRKVLTDFNLHLHERVKEEVAKSLKLEKNLARTERLASLGRLTASIAHELNNPLNSILMSAKLLEEEVEDEDGKLNIERIIRNTERAHKLIRDVSDLSRRSHIKKTSTNIYDLFKEAISIFQVRSERDNIIINIIKRSNLSNIFVMKEHLLRVIINILQNAFDAIKTDGQIDIQLSQTEKDIQIEIQDSGTGLDVDDSDILFEPFFSTKTTGTGLGLYLSYEIIYQHHGTISIHNPETPKLYRLKGAIVDIRLPINKDKINESS